MGSSPGYVASARASGLLGFRAPGFLVKVCQGLGFNFSILKVLSCLILATLSPKPVLPAAARKGLKQQQMNLLYEIVDTRIVKFTKKMENQGVATRASRRRTLARARR